jgi:riboflavin kinase/FMN adenylyltransferase
VRVTRLNEVAPRARRVAVGTFDGVHLGHREVIRGADTVLTFEPHPLAVVRPEARPRLIDTFAVKRDMIASLGVEELVVIPFDREMAGLEAEAFVEEVLVERLGASHVSVGENFRFGRAARGDPALLEERGDFETRVVPLVEVGGETVSSSRIRALVGAGEMREAAEFLGRPFVLEGPVAIGDRRGRELGVPTANIVPDEAFVVPGHGVYAARCLDRPAAASVGVRPTFGTGRGLLVEVHLIDWAGDLYGRGLRVAFLERLRGERRFETVSELVEQMWEDVDQARQIASASVRVHDADAG